MTILNTSVGYGAATKALHWAIVVLFAFQLFSAPVMVRVGQGQTALGMTGDEWYNWHKTIGLVALLVAIVRMWARRAGTLPDWSPRLSAGERVLCHRTEQALYVAMFVMPLSGFVHVMAGGYGVLLAGLLVLPNPIGRWPSLATAASWVHVVGAVLLLAALAVHLAVVLRRRLLGRMLGASAMRP